MKASTWPAQLYDSKATSPTGKVHYVTTGLWKNGNVEPLCNHKQWLGDYWGKKWKKVDKDTPVTCKNCLAVAGESTHKVEAWFGDRSNKKTTEFGTKAEADAYIQGVKDSARWHSRTGMINGKLV